MRICDTLGLTVRIRSAGKVLRSWNCDLREGDTIVSNGRGKGLGAQAIASALFESLEHYFYQIESYKNNNRSIIDLEERDSRLDNGSPNFRLILGKERPKFTRTKFESFIDSHEIELPTFLLNPDFISIDGEENNTIRSYGLGRYSTNSGTASGLSESEALLHSLLEVIERDSIGIELLRTIISRSAVAVRELMIDSLPDELVAVCKLAALEVDGKLSLWDISTDLNIPTILASAYSGRGIIRAYFGSGAALCPAYAIERAVLEAVQGFHTYNEFGSQPPLFGENNFVSSSLFQRCFLECGKFEFKGGSRAISFDQLPRPLNGRADYSVSELLGITVSSLNYNNISVYRRVIRSERPVICQVTVPQLERFHLVSQGIPVVPGERGKRALSSLNI